LKLVVRCPNQLRALGCPSRIGAGHATDAPLFY